MLLSHDCEYDKRSSLTVLVATVWPLAGLDANMQRLIRERKVISAFYLEAFSSILPESYADLRSITTLHKEIMKVYNAQNKRLVSLTDGTRLALQGQIGFFFGIERDRR
jgi:hypothetical protein